jgi:hypothetical protein
MKKFGLLIVTALMFLGFQAQTKKHFLKGQVTDIAGQPISQAKVMNQSDTTEFGLTDASGIFSLETVAKVQTLVVSKQGLLNERIHPASTFVRVKMLNGRPEVFHVLEEAVVECNMGTMDHKGPMSARYKRSAKMEYNGLSAPDPTVKTQNLILASAKMDFIRQSR